MSVQGSAAIQQVESNASKFDMILMDLQMPEMSGYEAAQRLRKVFQERGHFSNNSPHRAWPEKKHNSGRKGVCLMAG